MQLHVVVMVLQVCVSVWHRYVSSNYTNISNFMISWGWDDSKNLKFLQFAPQLLYICISAAMPVSEPFSSPAARPKSQVQGRLLRHLHRAGLESLGIWFFLTFG